MQTQKIAAFTDLIAWQKSRLLVVDIYKLTKSLPVEERFGLSDQMRRASVSVISNIAEGFSRQSAKEKKHFYFTALGSLTELHSQSIICCDLNYINNINLTMLEEKCIEVNKILNGLIKSIK
jgi:four helix bundle protein